MIIVDIFGHAEATKLISAVSSSLAFQNISEITSSNLF